MASKLKRLREVVAHNPEQAADHVTKQNSLRKKLRQHKLSMLKPKKVKPGVKAAAAVEKEAEGEQKPKRVMWRDRIKEAGDKFHKRVEHMVHHGEF